MVAPAMSNTDDRSQALGGLVFLGAVVGALLFLYGIAVESYWALALPVAALVLFVLGLVAWIGWTILTVRAEAEGEPLVTSGGGPGSATTPAPPEAEASPRSEGQGQG
jgi:hypothetical protein